MEIVINMDGQTVSVEVSIEVYEYLDAADHKEENLAHEQRRHWDAREFDECIIFAEGRSCYCQSPEQIVLRRETMQAIREALMCCTEHQRQRFLMYALEDMSCAQIAVLYGCSKVAVHYSIESARKKCKEFYLKHLND